MKMRCHKNIVTLFNLFLIVLLVIIICMLHVPSVSQSVQLPLSTIRILDIAHIILIPISILTFIIMIVKIARKKRDKYPPSLWINIDPWWKDLPIRSIACFLLSVSCIVVVDNAMTLALRNLAKAFLLQIDDVPVVKIDGESVENPQDLLMLLERMSSLPAHHSHATSMIKVSIVTNKGELLLELGRDSQRPQEYWVFYPALSVYTPETHIGGIITSMFDGY